MANFIERFPDTSSRRRKGKKRQETERFNKKKADEKFMLLRSMAKQSLAAERKEAEPKIAELKLNTTVTWGGGIYALNQPAQGSGVSNRIGDRIHCRKMDFNYVWTGSFNTTCRLVIVWVKQNTFLNPSDLFPSTEIGTTMATTALYNYDRRMEFVVLHDSLDTLSANGNIVKACHCTVPISKFTVFQTGSSTVHTGSLRLIVVTDSSAGALFRFQSRLLFTDE